ncbi:hypothetical protein [Longimicrobium sp.]|uniref:hypothetical protein n=1 Tax=Longimicrobium sp. TaxID=2029185 RepID=UPI002C38E247|nr:hypothetical protein [Longimicrobium sp.]HSU17170.1 hypothetical protein [Longimicrobium sp.]
MKQVAWLFALGAALCAAPAAARAQTHTHEDRGVRVDSHQDREELRRMMQPYVDSARATWPAVRQRFQAGMGPKQQLFAVTRLHDMAGHEEQVFIGVERIADGRVHGRIYSQIELVDGFTYGQQHDFAEADLVDWLVMREDGGMEGNFVGRFLQGLEQQ